MQRAPCAEAVVLPEAMDEDGVEARAIPAEPGDVVGRVEIAGAAGAERVDWEGEGGDVGVRGIVERGDLNGMAFALQHGGEAADSFCWTAAGGANGGDEVEKLHAGGWLQGLYRPIVLTAPLNRKWPNGIMDRNGSWSGGICWRSGTSKD